MKTLIKYLIVIFTASILTAACSKLEDEISPPLTPLGVHPEGFAKPGNPDFHAVWFKENNYNLKLCQQCHANNYSGGLTGTSCLSCHTGPEGPEACNTCHGDFSDPAQISPPRDLSGNTGSTARGVGSHFSHVYNNAFGENIDCYECHPRETGSNDKYVYAHVGNPPADIAFGEFASKSGQPIYNFDNLTCSDVYCHGNFAFKKEDSEFQWIYADSLIQGENFSPVWNKVDNTQAACGTCHLLPPEGHLNAGADPEAKTCSYSGCHKGIVSPEGKIINKSLHINGEPDGGLK